MDVSLQLNTAIILLFFGITMRSLTLQFSFPFQEYSQNVAHFFETNKFSSSCSFTNSNEYKYHFHFQLHFQNIKKSTDLISYIKQDFFRKRDEFFLYTSAEQEKKKSKSKNSIPQKKIQIFIKKLIAKNNLLTTLCFK